jgi:hypothetical protein
MISNNEEMNIVFLSGLHICQASSKDMIFPHAMNFDSFIAALLI